MSLGKKIPLLPIQEDFRIQIIVLLLDIMSVKCDIWMRKNNQKVLRNYISPSGKSPFLQWLNNLKDSNTRLRIRR